MVNDVTIWALKEALRTQIDINKKINEEILVLLEMINELMKNQPSSEKLKTKYDSLMRERNIINQDTTTITNKIKNLEGQYARME